MHDEPVVSYAKKEEKRQLEYVERVKAELKRLETERDSLQRKVAAQKDIAYSALKSVQGLTQESVSSLVNFLSGSYQWIVINDYSLKPPIPFADVLEKLESDYSRVRYDGLKLLTLFGKSDGNLEFRINHYSDGSGSNTRIFPFLSHEDAIAYIRIVAIDKYKEKRLNWDDFCRCIDMGIRFPEEVISGMESSIMETFNNAQSAVAKHEAEQMAIANNELTKRVACIAKAKVSP